MLFRKVSRNPPAFNAARIQDFAEALDLALLFKAQVGLARGVEPQLGDDVGLAILGNRGDSRDGIGRDNGDVTAVTLLHDKGGHVGDDRVGCPAHFGDGYFAAISLGGDGYG